MRISCSELRFPKICVSIAILVVESDELDDDHEHLVAGNAGHWYCGLDTHLSLSSNILMISGNIFEFCLVSRDTGTKCKVLTAKYDVSIDKSHDFLLPSLDVA